MATRDDLSAAYRQAVKAQGGKAALEILTKATGVDSVDAVAEDKIDAAIAALGATKPAKVKTLAGLHAHINNLASDIYENKNEQHRT